MSRNLKRKRSSDSVTTFNIQFLPSEMFVEILCRLPVESVLICRRVCKSWNSLIQEKHFIRQHLSKNRSLCYFPLRRNTQIASNSVLGKERRDAVKRRNCSIHNPLPLLYLPYTREDPKSITMFYAPSSHCRKVGYFYRCKNRLGQDFRKFEVFTCGVNNSWWTLEIPELHRLDKTKDTCWYEELFLGRVLHIAKICTDGLQDCELISVDIDLDTYTTSTSFPSRMLENCKYIRMARWKHKYPAIVGFVQDELHAVVLEDIQKGLLQKKVIKLKLPKFDLTGMKRHFKVYNFDDMFIEFRRRNMSRTYRIKEGITVFDFWVKSSNLMPDDPNLVTFKRMKPVNEYF